MEEEVQVNFHFPFLDVFLIFLSRFLETRQWHDTAEKIGFIAGEDEELLISSL